MKTILLITGVVAGIATYAQTSSDTTKTKASDNSAYITPTDEASVVPRSLSSASIKDLEYESWNSYYTLLPSENFQRDPLTAQQQPASRKTHPPKVRATRKE